MTNEQFNVFEERERERKNIEALVGEAFKNPKNENFSTQSDGKIEFNSHSVEAEDGSLKQAETVAQLKDEDIVECISKEELSDIATKNPHMYPFLLEAVAKKFQQVGYSLNVDEFVKYCLNHEYGHLVPALGSTSLKCKLGVSVIKDHKTGQIGLRPFMHFKGKTTWAEYKDIATGPTVHTDIDKNLIGKN